MVYHVSPIALDDNVIESSDVSQSLDETQTTMHNKLQGNLDDKPMSSEQQDVSNKLEDDETTTKHPRDRKHKKNDSKIIVASREVICIFVTVSIAFNHLFNV